MGEDMGCGNYILFTIHGIPNFYTALFKTSPSFINLLNSLFYMFFGNVSLMHMFCQHSRWNLPEITLKSPETTDYICHVLSHF